MKQETLGPTPGQVPPLQALSETSLCCREPGSLRDKMKYGEHTAYLSAAEPTPAQSLRTRCLQTEEAAACSKGLPCRHPGPAPCSQTCRPSRPKASVLPKRIPRTTLPHFTTLRSPTQRHRLSFYPNAAQLICGTFALHSHHSGSAAGGADTAPRAVLPAWSCRQAACSPSMLRVAGQARAHCFRHVEDAADTERGVCLVVQSVAGLVVGLRDIAVELLVLPLAHILGVHHPDGLKMEINREHYV